MARTRWSIGTSSKKAQYRAPSPKRRPEKTAVSASQQPRRRRPVKNPTEEGLPRPRRTRSQTAATATAIPDLTENEEAPHPNEEEPDVIPQDPDFLQPAAKKRKKVKTPVAPPTATSAPTQLTRYRRNIMRTLIEPRLFDWPSLHVLGVNDVVRQYFARIGWEKLLDIDQPVYFDFSLDFYSSFQFEPRLPLHDSRALIFNVLKTTHTLSVNSLNVLLGFETDESIEGEDYLCAACDMPSDFSCTIDDRWKSLSCESVYRKGSSKSAHIIDDGLRLCHRFLAHNLFGRTDMMNIVTMQEIFILENMLNGVKMNFGFWLATQWRYCANHFNHKMPLGALITQLAHSLDIDPVEPIAFKSTRFTVSDLQSMGLVFINDQGQFQLLSPSVAGSSTSYFAGQGASSSNRNPPSELQAWLTQQSLELKNFYDQHPPRWAVDLHAKIDALDRRLTQLEQQHQQPDPPAP